MRGKRREVNRGVARAIPAAALLAIVSGRATPALAEDRHWIGGGGDWDDVTHWSLSAGGTAGAPEPGHGDVVYVAKSSDGDAVIRYRSSQPATTRINTLRFDYQHAGAGELRLEIAEGRLAVLNESLGTSAAGAAGRIVQTGGVHDVTNFSMGSGPVSWFTYELGGDGRLAGAFGPGYIGGNSTFIQTGGTNNLYGLFISSTYSMSGGRVGSSSMFLRGAANFDQTGGTVSTLITLENSAARYTLGDTGQVAGTLTITSGAFNQNGGTVSLTRASPTIPGLDNRDHYNLKSGSLTTDSAANSGVLNASGGTLTTTTLTNRGTINLSGTAQLNVTTDLQAVTGSKLETHSASVTVGGTATLDAPFVSDGGATHAFRNLDVTANGYLQAGAGDVFRVTETVTLRPATATFWDTGASELRFAGGTSHLLKTVAADRGQNPSAWDGNLAWGALSLAAGESLVLGDADTLAGAAVYAHALRLEGGLAQLASITGNGVNLYYDPASPDNAYLQNGTYPLAGGGAVIPNTPEPGSPACIAAAATALTLRRGRRRRRRAPRNSA